MISERRRGSRRHGISLGERSLEDREKNSDRKRELRRGIEEFRR